MILTAREVAQYAHDAGFIGQGLVTAVAVAHAESGFNAWALGDINLTEPGERSVGLWQINYRPSRDKAGGLRDPKRNLDPAANAAAAFVISGAGKDFRPWSTFSSGAYLSYVPEAAAAVQSLEGGSMSIALTNLVPTPTGKGYWILAADGAVYAFGDAEYLGRLQKDADGNWQALLPEGR